MSDMKRAFRPDAWWAVLLVVVRRAGPPALLAMVLLAVCAAFLHTLTGFVFNDNAWEGVPDAQRLQQCAKIMQFKFPESTRPVRMACWSWQDATIILKLELDRADTADLIAHSPFSGVPLKSKGGRFFDYTRYEWWNPDRATKYRWAETQIVAAGDEGGPSEFLAILIDEGGGGYATVYLEWWTN